jgi:hypothetical protein
LLKGNIADSIDDKILMNNYIKFLFINKSKIFSIKLWLRSDDEIFFSSFIIDSSFYCLESIFVDGIESNVFRRYP